jgi:protocatechuate 3,4-dioxygenase beta subunit
MTGDDRPVGRVLSRRAAVTLLGAAGYAVLAGRARAGDWSTIQGVGQCVARPEQTEGPYFVDEALDRSDIRPDPSDGTVRPGLPLALTVVVSRLADNTCAPLAGAQVDVWHCDHLGVYSDVRDPQFDTTGRKFLRGYQRTDAAGQARFSTVYPGWYEGRTVHIHFKVRSPADQRPGYEFTSQLYFDDAVSDRVFAEAPYAGRSGRRTRNGGDGIYRRGGSQLLAPVEQAVDGLAAVFHVALQGV